VSFLPPHPSYGDMRRRRRRRRRRSGYLLLLTGGYLDIIIINCKHYVFKTTKLPNNTIH